MAGTDTTSGASSERADVRGEVLFFGTYDERLHPRIAVMREGLAEHGVRVTVLNEPLGVGTAQRVEMLRNPLRLVVFASVVLRRWVRLVRRARRLPRRPETVVVGYLGHFDVHLARMLFRRSTVVLDHLVGLSDTVRDRRLDGRALIDRWLELLDRKAMAAADVVVFDTADQRHHLGGRVTNGVVLPVGAPTQYFDAAVQRSLPVEGELHVLFFGLFTPLQGATTIARAIAQLRDEPGVRFTIVGKGQDHAEAHEAAKANPNVTWIHWVEPDALPELVARHDVCLGIFGTTPKALRVVPNKVYQGLASGAAIVTSDTPSQRSVLGAAAEYVPAGDADALALALRHLHKDTARLKELQGAAGELARQEFTPRAVTRELVDLLRAPTAPRRPASRPRARPSGDA